MGCGRRNNWFVAKLIVGKLHPEAPSRSFLIFTKLLEHTNHSTVARFVKDGLKVLWPQRVQEEKVLVLDSDAAAYILRTATALKVFLPEYNSFWTATCGGRSEK
jgi:hypothetical protein